MPAAYLPVSAACDVVIRVARPDRADALRRRVERSDTVVRSVVLATGEGPPGAVRNEGWQHGTAPWVLFLDDDVRPSHGWEDALVADLRARATHGRLGGTCGRIVPAGASVPPRAGVQPRVGCAPWSTADVVYRRAALTSVGGFDERFHLVDRAAIDLALRVMRAGWRLDRGTRTSRLLGPGDGRLWLARDTSGLDDGLMRAVHGPYWRRHAGAPPARSATVTSALAAVRRVRAGAAARRQAAGRPPHPRPVAVLFDRDGTLVLDAPYHGDPDRVAIAPGVRGALDRLRRAGIATGVISTQSGISRGLVTREQVDAVDRRIEELLGPLGPWCVCPHDPDAACACRKPQPGLVREAAARLGLEASECAVIGDTGADVEAALAAGKRPVLVPTPVTRPEEIESAPEVASTAEAAVDLLLGADDRETFRLTQTGAATAVRAPVEVGR